MSRRKLYTYGGLMWLVGVITGAIVVWPEVALDARLDARSRPIVVFPSDGVDCPSEDSCVPVWDGSAWVITEVTP